MGLNKLYRLGELIESCDERNISGEFTLDDIRGISIQKKFIQTKADMTDVSLAPYIVVKPYYFAYVTVTSRNGNKISIAYNDERNTYIVSSSYVVFRVNRPDLLVAKYLFIFFNRPEFDRYSRFNSYGSARETFSWEDFRATQITLPPKPIQEKYVAIYDALQANLAAYESRLEGLKLACDVEIDKIKHTAERVGIDKLLTPVDERNKDGSISEVKGINITKDFMPTVASVDGESINNYKVVRQRQFAFSGMQTGRDKCIRIALHRDIKPIIVSPAYAVLQTKNDDVLPEYIMLWFSRNESDRYGWFESDGSIRSNLELDRFFETSIPLPEKPIQQSIVNIYNGYIERQRIAAELKQQLKDICPILLRGSLEEKE